MHAHKHTIWTPTYIKMLMQIAQLGTCSICPSTNLCCATNCLLHMLRLRRTACLRDLRCAEGAAAKSMAHAAAMRHAYPYKAVAVSCHVVLSWR